MESTLERELVLAFVRKKNVLKQHGMACPICIKHHVAVQKSAEK